MEKWKPVPGFEDGYAVSNTGRVKSVARMRRNRGKTLSPVRERILKPRLNNYGFCQYSLSRNGVVTMVTAHRLVALAFIRNPKQYHQVNHVDGNKLNNNVSNLEWCSRSQNHRNKSAKGLYKPKTGRHNVCSKPVALYRKGRLVKVFGSIAEASRITGVSLKSISRYAKHGRVVKETKWVYK